MATANTNLDAAEAISPVPAGLLVSLAPLSQESFEATLANLALAFPDQTVLVATPDAVPQLSSGSPLRLLQYTPALLSANPWVLAPADYANAFRLAQENNASACLLLGSESQSDRKSTRLNSSHLRTSRMPSSA